MQDSRVVELLQRSPEFKEWIENTSLFTSIVQMTKVAGTPRVDYAEIQAGELTLNLNGVKVEQAEDLPVELIQEFYKNSPFFKTDMPKLLQ